MSARKREESGNVRIIGIIALLFIGSAILLQVIMFSIYAKEIEDFYINYNSAPLSGSTLSFICTSFPASTGFFILIVNTVVLCMALFKKGFAFTSSIRRKYSAIILSSTLILAAVFIIFTILSLKWDVSAAILNYLDINFLVLFPLYALLNNFDFFSNFDPDIFYPLPFNTYFDSYLLFVIIADILVLILSFLIIVKEKCVRLAVLGYANIVMVPVLFALTYIRFSELFIFF